MPSSIKPQPPKVPMVPLSIAKEYIGALKSKNTELAKKLENKAITFTQPNAGKKSKKSKKSRKSKKSGKSKKSRKSRKH